MCVCATGVHGWFLTTAIHDDIQIDNNQSLITGSWLIIITKRKILYRQKSHFLFHTLSNLLRTSTYKDHPILILTEMMSCYTCTVHVFWNLVESLDSVLCQTSKLIKLKGYVIINIWQIVLMFCATIVIIIINIIITYINYYDIDFFLLSFLFSVLALR